MTNKHRHGKLVDGGHSLALPGLKTFLRRLEDWDEINFIILGPIAHRKGWGGDLRFRATRWALVGNGAATGLKCEAVRGSMTQTVILTSTDPEALKRRLHAAGYVNW
jgi:hypothetical protein